MVGRSGSGSPPRGEDPTGMQSAPLRRGACRKEKGGAVREYGGGSFRQRGHPPALPGLFSDDPQGGAKSGVVLRKFETHWFKY